MKKTIAQEEHITSAASQAEAVLLYHPSLPTTTIAHLPLMDTLQILVDTNKTHIGLLLDNTETIEVINRITAEVVRKTWLSLNLLLGKEPPLHADTAGEER